MEKTPKIVPEEIHLLKIDVVKSEVNSIGFKQAKEPKVDIAHKLLHNLQDEMLKIELVFSFKNKQEEQLMLLQTDYHFQIERMNQFYKLEDEKPVFSTLLIATILGIAISTSRGILFEKLESSGIKNIIIPVISPQKILTKSH